MKKDKFRKAKKIMNFISLNSANDLKNLSGRYNIKKDDLVDFIEVNMLFLDRLGEEKEFAMFLRQESL